MYYTYMMRCEDGSLYTGITTDVNRRFEQHRGEKAGGAKFTRGRKPVAIERVWKSETRSDASKLEYRIKHLTKAEKELLVNEPEKIEALLKKKIDCELYTLLEIKAPNELV